MTHLHSGINGPVSGKVGNLVYYTIGGNCFVRRAPATTMKLPTSKRQLTVAVYRFGSHSAHPIIRRISAASLGEVITYKTPSYED
ncbi:MAG: hypothetical protein WKF68_04075 [Daejeonella sp.]